MIAGRVVLAEPRRAHRDRVGHHQPPRSPAATPSGALKAIAAANPASVISSTKHAVVVERRGHQPPRRAGDRRAREVGVVLERHLALAHALGDRPVERVEALHARGAVVVRRRGSRRRAAGLRRSRSGRSSRWCRTTARWPRAARPAAASRAAAAPAPRPRPARCRPTRASRRAPQRQRGHRRDRQRGQEARRARDPHVPLLARRAHQRARGSLRVHARPGRNGHGFEPSSGSVIASSASSTPSRANSAVPGEPPAQAQAVHHATAAATVAVHAVVAARPGELARPPPPAPPR